MGESCRRNGDGQAGYPLAPVGAGDGMLAVVAENENPHRSDALAEKQMIGEGGHVRAPQSALERVKHRGLRCHFCDQRRQLIEEPIRKCVAADRLVIAEDCPEVLLDETMEGQVHR